MIIRNNNGKFWNAKEKRWVSAQTDATEYSLISDLPGKIDYLELYTYNEIALYGNLRGEVVAVAKKKETK